MQLYMIGTDDTAASFCLLLLLQHRALEYHVNQVMLSAT